MAFVALRRAASLSFLLMRLLSITAMVKWLTQDDFFFWGGFRNFSSVKKRLFNLLPKRVCILLGVITFRYMAFEVANTAIVS